MQNKGLIRDRTGDLCWIDEMLSNYTGLVSNLIFFKKSKKFQKDIIQSLEKKKTYWERFLTTNTDTRLCYQSNNKIEYKRKTKHLNILILARIIHTALNNLHTILVPYDPSDTNMIFEKARQLHYEIQKISRRANALVPMNNITSKSNEIRNQNGNLLTDKSEHSNKDKEMPNVEDEDKEMPDNKGQSGQYSYMGKYWEGLNSNKEKSI
ncbi:uncharacterized protein EAE98_000936 [Botrytis deweyae]|uniref:Uncharacterized protein n=1 Tax=Botrytis deweyae TaxID=2478750 RepID=A0ABQ7J0J3_9HELO|nr:uncharacterized protein EAE98_000936 [Botrytis deweyae]KAF7938598.1 hypothetical protein EAE98_000936 [Botrytis deweyae]